MSFSKAESEEIKKQIMAQVEKLPNENKEQLKEYIKNLDDEGLEEFLKKNNIQISDDGNIEESKHSEKPQECIFCQIAKGKIPSHKIAENKKSLAILEINPLSRGHSIVLPKEHKTIDKMPKTAMSLAQKVAKKIKKKLKPDDIKIETTNFQGHSFVNIIPLYKDIPLKKTQASEEELKKIKSKLETKNRQSRKKPEKEETSQQREDLSKLPKIHFRIP